MNELQLNAEQTHVQLELSTKHPCKIEVFLHAIGKYRSMCIASVLLKKGKRKLCLRAEQFEKGVYIYTINNNNEQAAFGRLIVS
ncbi:MAG: hypothetical protein ACPGJS_07590 [Flammeovirgaceae bacterium]